jgi:type II secretory pathway component PulC
VVPVPPPKINFVYSGYIALGQKKMAIINGIEYREGDPLEIEGYVLKSVNAAMVVIENRKAGVMENVPLQD